MFRQGLVLPSQQDMNLVAPGFDWTGAIKQFRQQRRDITLP